MQAGQKKHLHRLKNIFQDFVIGPASTSNFDLHFKGNFHRNLYKRVRYTSKDLWSFLACTKRSINRVDEKEMDVRPTCEAVD